MSKDLKKIATFLVIIALVLVCSLTYAAIFAFYRDDSRIQLESNFKYTYTTSSPNISVVDDVDFTFPGGTTNRSYTITFNVQAVQDKAIYFAVYYANKSAGINTITGGARGYVAMGTTPTTKTITVNINNAASQTCRLGLIVITQDEYNGSQTTIYDSINDVTYTLI